jgi:hypothetical protein
MVERYEYIIFRAHTIWALAQPIQREERAAATITAARPTLNFG